MTASPHNPFSMALALRQELPRQKRGACDSAAALPLLLDARQGARLIGVSERQFHLLRQRPDFPRPVAGFGSRFVRFKRFEIEGWVSALPAADCLQEPERLAAARTARARAGAAI